MNRQKIYTTFQTIVTDRELTSKALTRECCTYSIPQTSALKCASVLSKLQFIVVSRTNLKEMKPDFLIFKFAFSLKTRTPVRPVLVIQNKNNIKENPIQKATDMFIVIISRTCPRLHEDILTPKRP